MTSSTSRPARPGSTAARAAVVTIAGLVGVAVACACLFGPMVTFDRPSPLELAAWWAGAAAGIALPIGVAALVFSRRRRTVVPGVAVVTVVVVAAVVGYGVTSSRAVAVDAGPPTTAPGVTSES